MSEQAVKAEPQGKAAPPKANTVLREILSANWLVIVLAIVIALVVGALLVAFTDPDVLGPLGYLFAKPGDFFGALWSSVSTTFVTLFKGAIINTDATNLNRMLFPLTETLTLSTPLIIAGLGLAVAFQAGIFNIGAQGQVILGSIGTSLIGFKAGFNGVGLLLLCILGGMLFGAIYAFIPGILKALTGAHEVIVTIMLNYIALNLINYLLNLKFFKAPGAIDPKAPPVKALFAPLWPDNASSRLTFAFIVALLAAVLVWFLMERTTVGFRFRAVGENPSAARTAGISVGAATVGVMVVSGAFAGLAGGAQVLSTQPSLVMGIAGTLGFDAITVALLGRSKPAGVVGAGILFGAFAAGGRVLSTSTGTDINIVLVLQAVVVLFVAAPPLVRSMFHLPSPRPKDYVEEVAA